MKEKKIKLSGSQVSYYFEASWSNLRKIVSPKETILVTDENVYNAHISKFKGWKVIQFKAGEAYKNFDSINEAIKEMINLEADRHTTLVGVGGGVVTDMTGFLASIYMRGIKVGYVPTTLLAMVDASIGGKNGIDYGLFKNMIGCFKQPEFLLFDADMLKTLPQKQWINGWAEVIKHACIKDASLFRILENTDISELQKSKKLLEQIIEKNVNLKTSVVIKDPKEQSIRRMLNFGHTIGHAVETQYGLLHGEAVAIGMVAAMTLSEKMLSFKGKDRVISLLKAYGLPTQLDIDKEKVFSVLKMDKKRISNLINFILLEKIGKASISPIKLKDLESFLKEL